jgi:putative hemolysin
LVDGRTTTFELNTHFGEEILEANPHYSTVAGFIIDQMKTMPDVGDKFENELLIVEVIDLDGRRIDKVLLTLKQNKLSDSFS